MSTIIGSCHPSTRPPAGDIPGNGIGLDGSLSLEGRDGVSIAKSGGVGVVGLTAVPPQTLKGNATSANLIPQDVPLSTLAAPGNPLGDAITAAANAPIVIDVRRFGAVGDGVTDDSVAIQNALTAAGNNGSLYFAGGYNFRCVGLTWIGSGVESGANSGRLCLFGDGPSSVLTIANNSGDMFFGQKGSIDVSKMTVRHPVQGASTGGFFFKFREAVANIRDVSFFNGYNVARWEDGCNQCGASNVFVRYPKNDMFQVDVSPLPPSTDPETHVQQHGNIRFIGITAQCFKDNTGAGLRAASADGLFMTDSLLAGFQNDVLCKPISGRSYLANLLFTAVVADGAGGSLTAGPTWVFDGTDGPLMRIRIVNSWANGYGRGLYAKNTHDLKWQGGLIIGNAFDGAVIDVGCQDVHFLDATVTGNGFGSTGNYDGIVIYQADKVSVKNCRIGPTHNGLDATTQSNTQRYGILVFDATTKNYELTGNDCSGNLSVPIQDGGGSGGRRLVADNPGYNPRGMQPITLGASPATYTAGAGRETVMLAGGVISSITVAGVPVSGSVSGGTMSTVHLNPNQSMVVTYSSAPAIAQTNRH